MKKRKLISLLLATILCCFSIMPVSAEDQLNTTEENSSDINDSNSVLETDPIKDISADLISESRVTFQEATENEVTLEKDQPNNTEAEEKIPEDENIGAIVFKTSDGASLKITSENGETYVVEPNSNIEIKALIGENVFVEAISDNEHVLYKQYNNGVEEKFVQYEYQVKKEKQTIEVTTKKFTFGKNSEKTECDYKTAIVRDTPIMTRSSVGETCIITPGTKHTYGSWSTNEFDIKTSTGNYLGYCAEPRKETPSGQYAVSEITNTRIKTLLMIGPGGPCYNDPGIQAYFNNFHGGTHYGYVHAVIGYAYSGDLTGTTADQRAWIQNLMNQCQDFEDTGFLKGVLNADPDDYKVFIAYTDKQDIVWLEKNEKGKVNLKKVSANPEMTNNNNCYSLAGAEYGLYTNAACTAQVGTFITDANGVSNTLTVKAGVYYAKETKAPKGFALSSEVKSLTVKANTTTTATFTFTDMPQMDPIGILLGKIDAETNKNKPQGSATLENAEFTVKYYAGLWEEDVDPATLQQTPERTWVFKTDEDGFCFYDEAYLTSGDELFKSASGVNLLPLGTITLQETKAPLGYSINNEIFVRQIKPDGQAENVFTYNYPEIPDNVIQVELIKLDKKNSNPIENAEFTLTWTGFVEEGENEEDAPTEETVVKTNADGKIAFIGLKPGKYVLHETKAPEGYVVNTTRLKFTVSEENKLSMDIMHLPTVDATWNQDKETQKLTITMKDKLAPFKITIHKTNDKNMALSGAEFSLYSDRMCRFLVKRLETDENGTLQFFNLEVGKTYYIKETKAPVGYRIPMENGKSILYEVYVESSPAEDKFIFYVNGQAYDKDSEGAYTLTGTKTDPVINMLIQNKILYKLPETGSNLMIPMLLIGSIMCTLSLKKKKK